jgi:hypothetical protein
MEKLEAPPEIVALDEAMERKLATLGELAPYVLARPAPGIIDRTIVLWPSNAIGRLRVVRRRESVLFATQGLSYPFNDLHRDRPPRLRYEVAIELPNDDPVGFDAERGTFGAASDETLARTWPVAMLWFLADAYVHERWQWVPLLEKFGLATTTSTSVAPLRPMERADGILGWLLGRKPGPPGDEVLPEGARLLVLQLLTPDEHAWATSVQDASRAWSLASALDRAGIGARSSVGRKSVLARS